jgi:hypothetical protein
LFDGTAVLAHTTQDGGGESLYNYLALNVRVRNQKYDTAWAIANQIVEVLDGRSNFILNDSFYGLIRALDSPSLLDWDENNRARFVVNFEVQRTRAVIA